MKTCLIFHNIIIEDERKIDPTVWAPLLEENIELFLGTVENLLFCLFTSQPDLTESVIEQQTKLQGAT